jgi:hypothetical protein
MNAVDLVLPVSNAIGHFLDADPPGHHGIAPESRPEAS